MFSLYCGFEETAKRKGLGADLHISFAHLDKRNIRLAINTDASLAEEIKEVLAKDHAMQAIVCPEETIWASSGSAKIISKDESGKLDVSSETKTDQTKSDQLRNLSQSDLDSLNEEFGKLDGSSVVKGLATHHTVSSHGKQKKGLDFTILFLKIAFLIPLNFCAPSHFMPLTFAYSLIFSPFKFHAPFLG